MQSNIHIKKLICFLCVPLTSRYWAQRLEWLLYREQKNCRNDWGWVVFTDKCLSCLWVHDRVRHLHGQAQDLVYALPRPSTPYRFMKIFLKQFHRWRDCENLFYQQYNLKPNIPDLPTSDVRRQRQYKINLLVLLCWYDRTWEMLTTYVIGQAYLTQQTGLTAVVCPNCVSKSSKLNVIFYIYRRKVIILLKLSLYFVMLYLQLK